MESVSAHLPCKRPTPTRTPQLQACPVSSLLAPFSGSVTSNSPQTSPPGTPAPNSHLWFPALTKGFTRNKKGILHSNLAVSVGGPQPPQPHPHRPSGYIAPQPENWRRVRGTDTECHSQSPGNTGKGSCSSEVVRAAGKYSICLFR